MDGSGLKKAVLKKMKAEEQKKFEVNMLYGST